MRISVVINTYNRAASLIERMEKEGIISNANHAGKREILSPPVAD
jgi:S-DNA-T family DNA segregation ATPase FtsK/SpoIIIE